ncbi:hypothetical protein ACIBF5_07340 [Micromonospora sp. NPDC050417]|uniref:hypothetical protein n=1 Tax=Micromonospora sp. NPDC050417 TaxID=3364280 RepID=UPI0037B6192B
MNRSPVRLSPLLAVLATTALLVVVATTTAVAGPTTTEPPVGVRTTGGPVTTATGSPIPRVWFATTCATGHFGAPALDTYGRVTVPAEITNCGPDSALFRFTIVSFRTDQDQAYAFDSQLRPYRSDGPTPVTATTIGRAIPGQLGVCLMRNIAAPVACLRLTFTDDLEMTAEPIPVDDPLVTKPVILTDDPHLGEPGGGCGTCFGLH